MSERCFNPHMLRLARDRRGVTQDDLAKRSGVTQALISKLEHGLVVQPSQDVAERLAAALGCAVAFLYEPGRMVGLPHFHQRERAKLAAKPLARIGAIINIQRQHIAKLMRSYEIEAAKPIPQIDLDESGLTPEKVAERLRAYWMLPRGPVGNVVELIEAAGGIVILARFGTALLAGISFRSEGLPPLFFMNKEMPGDRFRLSLARELGHVVMHTVPDDDEKMEAEAHRFAAAFMMPASDIKPYLAGAKLSALGRVKAYWKLPIKALIERTHELKLITDYQFKSLRNQYTKAFEAGEPVDVPLERPARLRKIVEYHRDRLGYSAQDLAALLAANVEDVETAYFDRPAIRLVASN